MAGLGTGGAFSWVVLYAAAPVKPAAAAVLVVVR